MNIIAIDLGKFNSMVCFYDTNSNEHSFQLASTDRRYLHKVLTTHACDLVVMEACFVGHKLARHAPSYAYHGLGLLVDARLSTPRFSPHCD